MKSQANVCSYMEQSKQQHLDYSYLSLSVFSQTESPIRFKAERFCDRAQPIQ